VGPYTPSLYEQLGQFYDDYTRTVTSGDLKRWPDFFTEDCLYGANSRENIEQGHPPAAGAV
jgi:salicylate 5-hydroxylase small subunit